jgi:hypothetical protein
MYRLPLSHVLTHIAESKKPIAAAPSISTLIATTVQKKKQQRSSPRSKQPTKSSPIPRNALGMILTNLPFYAVQKVETLKNTLNTM